MYKIILQCVFGATHDRRSCGYADVLVQVLVLVKTCSLELFLHKYTALKHCSEKYYPLQ
jgi:hypothetical protein